MFTDWKGKEEKASRPISSTSSTDSVDGNNPQRDRKLKVEKQSSIRVMTDNDPWTMKTLDVIRKKAQINMDVDRRELDKVAIVLRNKLGTSKNRRLVHSYLDSFKGAEAVTWLVTHAVCTDPEDAKNLMRHLLYRRIILRVDHTKPMFNSVIQSLAPSLAQWRRKKQLQWYQDNARQYNMAALYTFNVSAFAQYRLMVRLICAKGLRYTRHNHMSGKWETKRIAPLASVSLGGATSNTSVEEKTGDPRWDEHFIFDFDKDWKNHEEIWIKVFDFRELGESFPLGVCCISTSDIMKKCGLFESQGPPPVDIADAPGFTEWHPLLPPTSVAEPEEVRGGEVQVEFRITTNEVENADETVHDECRPGKDRYAVTQDDIQISNRSRGSATPRAVLKYQHLDRRNSQEIESKRPRSSSPATRTRSSKNQKDRGIYDRWAVSVSSLELHKIADIQAGSVVWVEIVAKSPRRSALSSKKKNLVGEDMGWVRRKKSTAFLWPKDGRKIVNAGSVSIPVPDDIIKYTSIEFRVIRKGDISNTTVGRGRIQAYNLRKAEEGEDDAESEASEVTQLDSEEDDKTLQKSPMNESMASLGSASLDDQEGKQSVPEVDELPFQPAVLITAQDATTVVLRKQAAFKRNIKIKAGLVYCYAKLKPLLADDDIEDGENLPYEEAEENHNVIDLEEALKSVIPEEGKTPTPIAMPDAFGNLYIDTTIGASVQRLATMLLGTDSKFAAQYAKERKNTDVKVGPWERPPDEKVSSQAEMSRADDEADDEEPTSSPNLRNQSIITTDNVESMVSTGFAQEHERPRSDSAIQSKTLDQTTSSENLIRSKSSFLPSTLSLRVKTAPSGSGTELDLGSPLTGESLPSSPAQSPSQSKIGTDPEKPESSADGESSVGDRKDSIDSFSAPRRVLTFMLPASALTKASQVTETQEILCMEPGGFVYTSTSETPDVPYGERFYTRCQFVISYVSPNESKIRISGEAVWKEKGPPGVLIKNLILNGVKSGHTEAYNALIEMLKQWVAPKRVTRPIKPGKKKKVEEESKVEKKGWSRWSKLLLAIFILLCMAGFAFVAYGIFTDQIDLSTSFQSFSDEFASRFAHLRLAIAGPSPSDEL